MKLQLDILAGGTALALYIGHRVSIDFDFYTPEGFDSQKILRKFEKSKIAVNLIQTQEDTLIFKANGIEISLFTYPYRLAMPLTKAEYLDMASLEDIAAMKIVAIIQRGIRRDFIDLYFLIKLLGLKKIFRACEKKYLSFNKYLALQALTYYDDADKAASGQNLAMLKRVSWEETKKFITASVKEFKDAIKK
jgi:predicted nucleotidyltransferase component of viral defense system